MEYLYFAGQILLAIFLGGFLGGQREKIGKSAGPRTYGLVSAGTALFTLLSLSAFGLGDPARVAAQVITGIGFIGAGVILHKHGGVVEGVTTAAGLWAVAAVGMAVGAGWYIQAIIVTFIMLLVLIIDDNKWVKRKK